MGLFSGKACFSPSVPRFLLTAWVKHGGTLVQSSQDFRIADYFFCDGLRDPWLSELLSRSAIVLHANWVWKSVSEQFSMPVARYVLDDHFQPFDHHVEAPNTIRNDSVCVVSRLDDCCYRPTHSSSAAAKNQATSVESNAHQSPSGSLLLPSNDTTATTEREGKEKDVDNNDNKNLSRSLISSPKETGGPIVLDEERPARILKRPVGSEYYSDSELQQQQRPRKKTRFFYDSIVSQEPRHASFQTGSRRRQRQQEQGFLVAPKNKLVSVSNPAVPVSNSEKRPGLLVSRIPRYKFPVSIRTMDKNKCGNENSAASAASCSELAIRVGVPRVKTRFEELLVPDSTTMTMAMKTSQTRTASPTKKQKEILTQTCSSSAKDLRTDFFQASKQDLSLSCNLPLRISVAALLEAVRDAPSSGAVLFTPNGEFNGRRFSCVKRGKLRGP